MPHGDPYQVWIRTVYRQERLSPGIVMTAIINVINLLKIESGEQKLS